MELRDGNTINSVDTRLPSIRKSDSRTERDMKSIYLLVTPGCCFRDPSPIQSARPCPHGSNLDAFRRRLLGRCGHLAPRLTSSVPSPRSSIVELIEALSATTGSGRLQQSRNFEVSSQLIPPYNFQFGNKTEPWNR